MTDSKETINVGGIEYISAKGVATAIYGMRAHVVSLHEDLEFGFDNVGSGLLDVEDRIVDWARRIGLDAYDPARCR